MCPYYYIIRLADHFVDDSVLQSLTPKFDPNRKTIGSAYDWVQPFGRTKIPSLPTGMPLFSSSKPTLATA